MTSPELPRPEVAPLRADEIIVEFLQEAEFSDEVIAGCCDHFFLGPPNVVKPNPLIIPGLREVKLRYVSTLGNRQGALFDNDEATILSAILMPHSIEVCRSIRYGIGIVTATEAFVPNHRKLALAKAFESGLNKIRNHSIPRPSQPSAAVATTHPDVLTDESPKQQNKVGGRPMRKVAPWQE